MTLSPLNNAARTRTRAPLTLARFSVPHKDHPDCNEDAILTDGARGLAAVFDGVGIGGHVASRLAVRIVRNRWRQIFFQASIPDALAALDMPGIVQQLGLEANTSILAEGARRAKAAEKVQKEYRTPGTTFVLAAIHRQEHSKHYTLTYAHAGDSRIYLLHNTDVLKRLTDDDGYLGIKLREGLITPEDALRIDQATAADQLDETEYSYFEKRNGITQSLGTNPPPTIHLAQIEIAPGDRILLCSDGIHDNLTDLEIKALLQNGVRTTVARAIVQQAIERSLQQEDDKKVIRAKSDDMSAIVITCNC